MIIQEPIWQQKEVPFDYKELLGMGDDEEDIEDGYDFDDLF